MMAMVILSMSLSGFAHAAELSVNACAAETVAPHGETGHQCPTCPVDEHSTPDHCDSSCHCPCHAPLMLQPVEVACSRQITLLLFSEPFKALPEVYLSKFIPPHILV